MISKERPYRFLVLALACALAFMGNYLQYQVSALGVEVMTLLDIGPAGFQMLFLIPMLAAVFFSIPFGVLGDRFGPKRVISIAFAIAAIGGFLRLANLENFPLQLACMFMIGIGMAALTANNAKTLGIWFKDKTDFAMGFYYACSCLGISAAQATAAIPGSITTSYLAADIILIALVALWIILDKDLPAGATPPRDAATAPTFSHVSKNKSVWLIALCAGLSLAATTGYAGILPQAMEVERGMGTLEAGQTAALLTLGSMVGCIVTPILCAQAKSMKVYLVCAAIAGALVMMVTWAVPGNGVLLFCAMVLNGLLTSLLGPIMQALPISLPSIGARFAGSAGGIIAEVSLLLSFALPIAVSFIAGQDYLLTFVILSGCYAATLIPILLLRYPRSDAKNTS